MDIKRKSQALLGAGKDILKGFRALVLPRGTGLSPEQRRKLTRLHCLYRVACNLDGMDLRATVVDMGLRGMRLEVPQRVVPGALMSVRYLGASATGRDRRFSVDTVHTRVLWCRRKRFLETIEVGVAYHDSDEQMEQSWVKYILRQIGFDIQSILDRRKSLRVQALLRADLKSPRGLQGLLLEGTVINLGAGGALVECDGRMSMGTAVVLEAGPYGNHPMLACRGEVVQAKQSAETQKWLIGVRFQDVEPRQVTLLGEYLRTLLAEAATL